VGTMKIENNTDFDSVSICCRQGVGIVRDGMLCLEVVRFFCHAIIKYIICARDIITTSVSRGGMGFVTAFVMRARVQDKGTQSMLS